MSTSRTLGGKSARMIHVAGTATATAMLLIGTISGCEEAIERPKTVPVAGKVTYKGAPVPKGTVTFQPDKGDPAVGEIQSDGAYRLSTYAQGDGAVPGHHRVFIIANTADPTKIPESTPGWTPPKDLIPKKYNNLKTSGLEANVSEEKKEINFDLP
jgi:hypothetical protein